MYSNHNQYGSPPPELSNNPFIDHTANALTRYPDVTGSDSPSGSSGSYTSWMQSGAPSSPTGYPAAGSQQYAINGGYQGVQQQNTWNTSPGYQTNPYGNTPQMQMQAQPTGQPFQPSSSFGQHLATQINSGYGQQQTGYPSSPSFGTGYQGGYGASQQQQAAQYLSEFDPYSNSTPRPSAAAAPSFTGGSAGGGSQPPTHPRQYIQQHKAEMEAWDQYTWKQAFNAFDALKDAWGVRKREIEDRAKTLGGAGLFGGGYGGYSQAQEIARLEALAKEAGSNFDSVAASTFQMQEVFSGYRQSGDMASKRRVRESINAALGNLPDWPN